MPAYIRLSSLWTAGSTRFRDMLDRLAEYEAEQVRQAAPVEVMGARLARMKEGGNNVGADLEVRQRCGEL